jgi:hypothetical protein
MNNKWVCSEKVTYNQVCPRVDKFGNPCAKYNSYTALKRVYFPKYLPPYIGAVFVTRHWDCGSKQIVINYNIIYLSTILNDVIWEMFLVLWLTQYYT